MNKPYHLCFLIVLLIATSCSQEKTKTKEVVISKTENVEIPPPPDYYLTSKETQRHAIFKFDSTKDSSLFERNVKASNLSKAEISSIEKLIAMKVNQYNKKAYKAVKYPEKYFKQLIPVINSKGEKEVWVNCFCGVTPDWKKYREQFSDGGNCFLSFRINLTKNKVVEFHVSGLA